MPCEVLKLGRWYRTTIQNFILQGQILKGELAALQNQIDHLLSWVSRRLSTDSLLIHCSIALSTLRTHRRPTASLSLSFGRPPGSAGSIAGRRNIFVVVPVRASMLRISGMVSDEPMRDW